MDCGWAGDTHQGALTSGEREWWLAKFPLVDPVESCDPKQVVALMVLSDKADERSNLGNKDYWTTAEASEVGARSRQGTAIKADQILVLDLTAHIIVASCRNAQDGRIWSASDPRLIDLP